MGDFLKLLRTGKFTTTKKSSLFPSNLVIQRANGIIDSFVNHQSNVSSEKNQYTSFFRDGKVFKRQNIHDQWGGARWSGISVPVKVNALFLFTNKSQSQRSSGYDDGWEGDKFYYSGCGSIGDQKWNFNNLEIRDHVTNGKEMLLFENIGDGFVRLVGRMQLLDYYRKDLRDTTGKTRKIIQFVLGRKTDPDQPEEEKAPTPKKKRNLDEDDTPLENSNTTVKRPKISDKENPSSAKRSDPSTPLPSQLSLSDSLSQSEYISPDSSQKLRKSGSSQYPPENTLSTQPMTQYESLSQYPSLSDSLSLSQYITPQKSQLNLSQSKLTQYDSLSQSQNTFTQSKSHLNLTQSKLTQYDSLSQSQSQQVPFSLPKSEAQFLSRQKATQQRSLTDQKKTQTEQETQYDYISSESQSLSQSQKIRTQPKTQEDDDPIDPTSPQSSQGDSQQPPVESYSSYLDPLPLSQPKTQVMNKKNNTMEKNNNSKEKFPSKETAHKLSHFYNTTPLHTQPSQ